ncbi:MAG: MarR family transcriptional regulator [bacterium]|nr:MarR family transcriptional regulator [bacterium]MDT8395112.1 MarR family transcriptional regulator [bacterium]
MSDPIHTIAQLYPRLMRAMGHLRGAVDETMDLTYNQYKALLTLSDTGPCTLNTLSQELGVATSSASQMVDRLFSMDLVVRTPADEDRRRIVLNTSREGEDLLDRVKEDIVRRYQDLFKHLGPAEQSNLAGAIHTLVRILERAIQEEERGK